MSITQYGIAAGQFIPQSDFRTSENPNGGVTATQSYVMRRDSLEGLVADGTWAKGTSAGSLDSNLGLQGDNLYLDRTSTENLPGGYAKVTAFFAGFSTTSSYGFDENRAVVPTYMMQTSLTELSIMKLPQVKNLTSTEQRLVQSCIDRSLIYNNATSTVQYVWIDGDDQLQSRNNPDQPGATAGVYCEYATKGQTTYPAPQFIWEKTWDDEAGLTASDISKMGSVDTPDGSPPALPGGRNWMLSDVSFVKTGELFRNRKAWLGSEPGGWEGFLE